MKRSVRLTLASICAVIITICCLALGLYTFNYMGFEDGKLKFYFGQKDEEPDEPTEPLDTKYTIHLVWSEGNKSQDYTYDPANETFSPKIQNTWVKNQPYRFDGWYADELYHDMADSATIRNGDTLYAKMIEQVTVTIHNVYPGNKDAKEEFVLDKNSVLNLDDVITSTEAQFIGAYLDEEKTQTATNFQASANTDIYAYWSSKYSDFTWELDKSSKTATIVEGYKGESNEVIVPGTYKKSGITYKVETGYLAFYNCTSLTSITIGNGVTNIGDYAFYNCTGLISITIPDSVTSIGEGAFTCCSDLTSITIPDSVTSIGEGAFYGCSNLISITVPNSVTSIGDYVFEDCSGLITVTLNQTMLNQSYSYNSSSLSTYFPGCSNITTVIIPGSVTSIGSYAFCRCSSLTSITIPDGVTSIGSYAFSHCTGLTGIIIPDGVTSIGSYAFEYCGGLTSMTIPSTVTTISSCAFCGCDLTSITIQATTPPTLDSYAFYNCYNLTTIYVPAESVEAYKSASSWSSYADKIQAIQE